MFILGQLQPLDSVSLLSYMEEQQMSRVSKGLNESSGGIMVQLNLPVSWIKRHIMASLKPRNGLAITLC